MASKKKPTDPSLPKEEKQVFVAPNIVDAALTDRYLHGLSVKETITKNKITQEQWRALDVKFSKVFKEKYGSRKISNALTEEQMSDFWSKKDTI